MSNSDTPTDKQQLREEIEQTRAELGDTVEALAAKADVKARAKEAASDATERAKAAAVDATDRAKAAASDAAGRAKEALGAARVKAADATGSAVDATTAQASVLQDRFAEARQDPDQRRTLNVGALVAAVAVLGGLVAWLVRRRRA